MIHPEQMQRITLLAPRQRLQSTIEILYQHKVLHVVDHAKDKIDIGSPLQGSEQIAELLVTTRSLIHSLHVPEQGAQAQISGNLAENIERMSKQAGKFLNQKRQLEEELQKAQAEHAAYTELSWLRINPVKLSESKHLAYLFGTIKDSAGISEAVSKLTDKHYLELQHSGHGVLLIIAKEHHDAARELLLKHSFVPLDHNRITKLDKPLHEHLHGLRETIIMCQRELRALESSLTRLGDEYGATLRAAEALLATEAKKAQAPLRFGVAKRSFIINGWVPQANVQALKAALEAQLKGEVHIVMAHTHEDAPVKLDNSFVVSPYEALLRLYTLPKSWEIDPSTFLFLSFPIFFGFMLGDIGYGIVLLILAIILHRTFKKNNEVRSMASILIMSSVASVVFGIVFGEFFGLENMGPIEFQPLIHRTHSMETLLGVAIAVGVIHITLALIIGFFNELHHHGGWKAFCAKISWILLLAAVGLIGAGKVFHVPTIIPGAVLAVVSVILIYIGEGIKGLIELPGIFSNILSYARLMALGVASAALAMVINDMAKGLFASGGIGGIIAGVLILILGHAINFALGIMGPFLHSLRLHYVEFFSKFYEGGGKPYKPFGSDEA